MALARRTLSSSLVSRVAPSEKARPEEEETARPVGCLGVVGSMGGVCGLWGVGGTHSSESTGSCLAEAGVGAACTKE